MTRKPEILLALSRSRSTIVHDLSIVRSHLDMTARVKNAVRTRPWAWFGVATAFGYILAGPKTRTKTVVKLFDRKSREPIETAMKKGHGIWGLVFSLVKFLIPLVRPVFSAYAVKRFGNFFENGK